MLSYKRLYDFTQSYAKPEMQKYLKDAFDALEKEKGLKAFSFGIGYSTAIQLEKTEYAEKIPHLNQETTKNGNFEFGLGYYSHKLDAAARVSYRPLKQKETGYN